jgi:hypothetical protein
MGFTLKYMIVIDRVGIIAPPVATIRVVTGITGVGIVAIGMADAGTVRPVMIDRIMVTADTDLDTVGIASLLSKLT